MSELDNNLAFNHLGSGEQLNDLAVGDNENRMLLVEFSVDAATPDVEPVISYDGVALTYIGKAEDAGGSVGRCVYLYGLVAPTIGTNSLSTNVSSSVDRYNIVAVSIYDAEQTLPTTIYDVVGSGTDMSISGISANINDLILGFGSWNNTTSVTEGADQELITGTSFNAFASYGWASHKTAASTSESMSWSGPSNSFGGLAVVVPSAPGVRVFTNNFTDGDESSFTLEGFDSVTSADIDGYALSIVGDVDNGFAFTVDIAADTDLNGDLVPNVGGECTLTVNGLDSLGEVISASNTLTISVKNGWGLATVGTPDKSGDGTQDNPNTLAQNLDIDLPITTGSATLEKIYYYQAGGDDYDTGGTECDSSLNWRSSTDSVSARYIYDGVGYSISINYNETIDGVYIRRFPWQPKRLKR